MLDFHFSKDLKENHKEKVTGVYHAKVTGHNDPLFLDRVQVRVYGIHTDDESLLPNDKCVWAEVLAPYKMAISPTTGDEVYVLFLNDDPNRPLVIGEMKKNIPGGVGNSGSFGASNSFSGGMNGEGLTAAELEAIMGDTETIGSTLDEETLNEISGGQLDSRQKSDFKGSQPQLIKHFMMMQNYAIKTLKCKKLHITSTLRPSSQVADYLRNPAKYDFKPPRTSFHKYGAAVDLNPIGPGGDCYNTARFQNKEPIVLKLYKMLADLWHAMYPGQRWGGPESMGGDFYAPIFGEFANDLVHFDLGYNLLNKIFGKGGKALGSNLLGSDGGGESSFFNHIITEVENVTGDKINKSDVKRGALDTKYKAFVINPVNGKGSWSGKKKKIQNNLPKKGTSGTQRNIPLSALGAGTGFNASGDVPGWQAHLKNIFIQTSQTTVNHGKLAENFGHSVQGISAATQVKTFLHAGGGYKQESKMNYNAKYPESWVIAENGGNYINMNDRKDSESITVGHKSGSWLQFAPDGSIRINSKESDVEMTADLGLHLYGTEEIQMSSHKLIGLCSEGNFIIKSGFSTRESTDGMLNLNLTKALYVNLQETKNSKRQAIYMDPKKEELILILYPEQGADEKKVHHGSKKPVGYIKISNEKLVVHHEKQIILSSPSTKKTWLPPAPELTEFDKNLAHDVEPLLTSDIAHSRGIS